jgi:hypothetical protein
MIHDYRNVIATEINETGPHFQKSADSYGAFELSEI